MLTVAFGSVVPTMVGRVTLVRLSVFDVPESEAVAKKGTVVAGATVSMVTDNAADADDAAPVPKAAVAVNECAPADRGESGVKLYRPELFAVVVPRRVVPS